MSDDLVELATDIALHEIEVERMEVAASRPTTSIVEALRLELDVKFREIWDANNKREYHRTGRRRGKSHYLIRRSVAAGLSNPYSVNPYILPTAKSANLVIWPLMKRIVARHFGTDARIDETMKTVTLPGEGSLVVGGCETESDVGRWFGMPFADAIIDECGNFPDRVLAMLEDEALEPALMDFDGNIRLGGNPGRILRGRWYEETGPRRSDTTPLYEGDARDNPFLATPAQELFDRVLERRGWTIETPTFRRQYLGLWVEDGEGLVFPLSQINVCAKLPTHSLAYGVLPPELWYYSLGIDVGQTEDTALVLVAAHPLDNREFIVHTEKHQHMLIAQLGERVKDFKRRFKKLSIVIDTGGMGKQHARELGARFGLYLEPAVKTEKASQIQLTRDGVLSGRLLLLDGACCDPIRDEWSALTWNDDKDGWEDGPPDHATDAGLYALRRLRHHQTTMAGADSSRWASPDALALEICDKLRQSREQQVKRRLQYENRRRRW